MNKTNYVDQYRDIINYINKTIVNYINKINYVNETTYVKNSIMISFVILTKQIS